MAVAGRARPIPAHTAGRAALPPKPPLPPARVFNRAAIQRAPLQRGGRVHTAAPISHPAGPYQPQYLLGWAYDISALHRPETRRTVPAAHLAKPVVPNQPSAAHGLDGIIGWAYDLTALQRPYIGRKVPFKALPPANLNGPNPGPPPLIIDAVRAKTAQEEQRLRDTPPKPHLARPISSPPGPGALARLQAVARAVLRRSGSTRTAAPIIATAAPPFIAPNAKIVAQAVSRSQTRRGVAAPKLAPAQLPPTIAVYIPQLAVFHAPAASQTLRQPLKPKTAKPIVSSTTPTFIAPNGVFKLQPQRRAGSSPRPHLAPSISRPPGPGILSRLQAVARQRTGWTPPKPHTAQPNLAPAGPGSLTRLQALARALTRRTIQLKPRTAAPNLQKAGPGASIRTEAISRAQIGRSGHVRYTGPVLQPGRIRATITTQARQRALVHRTVPLKARYARPIVNTAIPQPPTICYPTAALIVPYASTPTFVPYASQPIFRPYSSTTTIPSHQTGTTVFTYGSAGSITGYSSATAIVNYTSGVTHLNTCDD